MIYSDFQGKKLSLLGFGTMRLPLMRDGNGEVDEEEVLERHVEYGADGERRLRGS